MILKDCSICTIYGRGHEPLRARVRYSGEMIFLYFEDIEKLPDDTDNIPIDFMDSQSGCIKTVCELHVQKNTDPWILEPWGAKCAILDVKETIQRQNDVRVKIESEVAFYSLSHGHFTGMIQNISGGGIYMVTNMTLDPKEEFEFDFTFGKREHHLRARVLRQNVLPKNEYGYGCQFLNVSKAAERDIRQFVFKQQLTKMR